VIIKATVDAGGLEEVWAIAVNGSRIEFDKWVIGWSVNGCHHINP
jgi:hypothetical protein